MRDAARVFVAENLQQAYVISGMLEHAGFSVHIRNEYVQGALGELPFANNFPEIWVDDGAQLGRARNLIRSWQKNLSEEADVSCPNCGQKNPANFEVCWACKTGLETV